jgi:hypothetical protein
MQRLLCAANTLRNEKVAHDVPHPANGLGSRQWTLASAGDAITGTIGRMTLSWHLTSASSRGSGRSGALTVPAPGAGWCQLVTFARIR